MVMEYHHCVSFSLFPFFIHLIIANRDAPLFNLLLLNSLSAFVFPLLHTFFIVHTFPHVLTLE